MKTKDRLIDLLKEAGIGLPAAGFSPEWLGSVTRTLTFESQSRPLSQEEATALGAMMTEALCFGTSRIYEELEDPLKEDSP